MILQYDTTAPTGNRLGLYKVPGPDPEKVRSLTQGAPTQGTFKCLNPGIHHLVWYRQSPLLINGEQLVGVLALGAPGHFGTFRKLDDGLSDDEVQAAFQALDGNHALTQVRVGERLKTVVTETFVKATV